MIFESGYTLLVPLLWPVQIWVALSQTRLVSLFLWIICDVILLVFYSGLPVAEILVLAGFLFIYTTEELMHMILVWTGNIQVCTISKEYWNRIHFLIHCDISDNLMDYIICKVLGKLFHENIWKNCFLFPYSLSYKGFLRIKA